MTAEALVIPGSRGTSIPATLTRSEGRELAVLFPGLTYRNSMPVMHFARLLMVARGADVLAVNYTYDRISGFRDLPGEEKLAWIGADGRAALAAALDLGSYERTIVIGKSLGTIAMGWAVPDEPRLAAPDLVLLTPSVTGTRLVERMQACCGRSIIVIGSRDPGFDPGLVAVWERDGKTSVVIPGADHGLERPGDPIGSVEALGEMLRPLASWLDKAGA